MRYVYKPTDIQLKSLPWLITFLWCLLTLTVLAQQEYPTLIRSYYEDEIVVLTVDKPVYYQGETVKILLRGKLKAPLMEVVPVIVMDGISIIALSDTTFIAIIPALSRPGPYRIRLRARDNQGRMFYFESDCILNVEEHHKIERLERFVSIFPDDGGKDIGSAVTLRRDQIRDLRVLFNRDSIPMGVGPQFITIRTTVTLRDGTSEKTIERRVLTFRNDQDPNRDLAMLRQYRNAYGEYAAINPQEFEEVHLNIDSLPDWAVVRVTIEPDYSIKIGGYDRFNVYTRFFHVRGPSIEVGFALGIPKVLYDTQADDPLEYGNTSAMIRFYLVSQVTGKRFPINLGIGTFGVNSPLDVDIGRGGFALSLFLNLAEMTESLGIDFMKNISAGLEVTPFFPIQKRWRFLLNVQLGINL